MLRQREKVQCSNVELKEENENLGIIVANSRNTVCNAITMFRRCTTDSS